MLDKFPTNSEVSKDLETVNKQQVESSNEKSVFDDFLLKLREKQIRVSTPEWLSFLTVVKARTQQENLVELVEDGNLLHTIYDFGRITLVKNKTDEKAYRDVFEECFGNIVQFMPTESKEENIDNGIKPDLKDKLGIEDVQEGVIPDIDQEHSDTESVHGGNKDQHNDILRQSDSAKIGGGEQVDDIEKEKRDQDIDSVAKDIIKDDAPTQVKEKSTLIGQGKGNSKLAEAPVMDNNILTLGSNVTAEDFENRNNKIKQLDRRKRYELRPNRTTTQEAIKNIRRIISDITEMRTGRVDVERTIENIAQRNVQFEYQIERQKQPEIVMFIDVGGPVDQWSPLVNEVVSAMLKGLTKLEVYLFHNNLYGYVWKPDPKNLLKSSFAEPNSLVDIKKIVKHRKKVIIYGDAEMSYSEFEADLWKPSDNEERIKKYGMNGKDCLRFIKKTANSVVWINPIFKKDWRSSDASGTLQAAQSIIPMYDLTVGGIEDAVKDLIKQ